MMNKKPFVLFRNYSHEEERKICENICQTSNSRMDCKKSLVIARYSALPFYAELERDLKKIGSQLINSYQEHSYIANFDYYWDVADFTPKTYFYLADVPSMGKFIIKGKTNSRKEKWHQMMFAKNHKELVKKYLLNMDDPFLNEQDIIIREYIPLKKYGTSLSGIPFSNEWRFFFYKKTLLTYGYYWSNAEIIPDNSSIGKGAIDFAKKIANIIGDKIPFFSLDIAQTKKGDWILVEANDGQMSGLSCKDAQTLYENLIKEISTS